MQTQLVMQASCSPPTPPLHREEPIDSDFADSPGSSDNEKVVSEADRLWPSCRSITKYRVIEFLGEGTFGVVYRAIDRETAETFAIKKVSLSSSCRLSY